jgi:hypothetical protein
MDSSDDSGVSLKVFSFLSFSFGFCCLILCCCVYILSRKKKKQQNQIHFENHGYGSDAHAHICTIDVPDVGIFNSSYAQHFDLPPPPYETIDHPSPSNVLLNLFSYSRKTITVFIFICHSIPS